MVERFVCDLAGNSLFFRNHHGVYYHIDIGWMHRKPAFKRWNFLQLHVPDEPDLGPVASGSFFFLDIISSYLIILIILISYGAGARILLSLVSYVSREGPEYIS